MILFLYNYKIVKGYAFFSFCKQPSFFVVVVVNASMRIVIYLEIKSSKMTCKNKKKKSNIKPEKNLFRKIAQKNKNDLDFFSYHLY